MAPLLPDPRRAIARLVNQPTGVGPLRHVGGVLDALGRNGPSPLERAVSDRVVLITGASSGIGAASAERIGAAGATVLLVARREAELSAVAERIAAAGGSSRAYPADLSEVAEIERLTAEVLHRHGRVDVLVNNAGKSIRRSIDLSYDRPHDFERTMQLNYLAPVRLVLAFLPGMRERGFGHVINISTTGVQIRGPRFSGYIASKAALEAFSECVAGEVAHDGVRFTTIRMPLVRTPMIAPTGAWRGVPSISAEQASDRVCEALVHRPRRIGTVMGDVASALQTASPGTAEALRNRGYRTTRDSPAARGEGRASG